MNNNGEETVREVLEALGRVNRFFRDAAVGLDRLPQIESVATALEVMHYDNGSCIEGYVDAELKDGNGFSWLLKVTWDAGSWTIRGRLEKNSASGNETVEEITSKSVPRVGLLPDVLTETVEKLLQLRPQELKTKTNQPTH